MLVQFEVCQSTVVYCVGRVVCPTRF